jgi:hypothetical protein
MPAGLAKLTVEVEQALLYMPAGLAKLTVEVEQ